MEEAANADTVAFLRGGKILEEGRPADMLQRFSCNSLEILFLQLCYDEEKKSESNETRNLLDFEGDLSSPTYYDNSSSSIVPYCDIMPTILKQKISSANLSETNLNVNKTKVTWMQKTNALLFKNLMVLKRHRLFMMFNVLLPVLNFSIFFQAIGRPVTDLTISYSVMDSANIPLYFNNDSNANTASSYSCSHSVHFVSSQSRKLKVNEKVKNSIYRAHLYLILKAFCKDRK